MEYYDNMAKGYNELHKEEQETKLRIISRHLNIQKNERLLDLGCGTGLSFQFFQCRKFGLEPSRKMLLTAKRVPDLDLVQGEGERLPFCENAFDHVICVTALHNFSNPESALKEINRVCKSTGAITILKKAQKAQSLWDLVAGEFQITNELEESKDIILFFEIKQ